MVLGKKLVGKPQFDPTAPVSLVVPTGSPTATPKATKSPTPTPKPTPTPTPVTTKVTLGANGSLDGFEASNGGGNTANDIRAGRNTFLNTRGFVSFDIPSTLSGKTIDKATVRIYQTSIDGSPYNLLGSLKIDHLDYGNSLENSDYGTTSLSSSFNTVTSNAAIEWKDVDVTDMVRDDLSNSRQRSQFRIHFQTEGTGGDATGDFAHFESADNTVGTSNTPQLVVTYH